MNLPEVYWWISDRYPFVTQIVPGKYVLLPLSENMIAQFDNFYMDLNSIIHSCSRLPNCDVNICVTEEKIFEDIFYYIELLFKLISPKKLFFIAVDGVAPWAKVNKERGLRFQTAEKQLLEEARKTGTVASEIEGFDSNCITPGTEFMAKLQQFLEESIGEKISHDSTWQGIEIHLSGHNVPGEGENKIMEFIRYARSQANYNRYTRHCLYGLETDLILYGMSSHEPLFTLFRECDNFTRETSKNTDEIDFYLVHLSLLREYLENEFYSLKELGFDLEMIIDDWVFMMFLIGNDFIPPLPHFTSHNYFLSLLYDTYKKVLPTLDGYINEHGQLNLVRFETFMNALSWYGLENFDKNAKQFQLNRKTYYDDIKNFKKDRVSQIVSQYVDAIQWNLNYYYDGCTSWRFYYPYNYSPYASDVAVYKKNRVEDTLVSDEPLLPLQQLLAVLPPKIINEELADLYPTKFATDHSVVLIPFVDPNRLTKSVEALKLTNAEEKRNVHRNHLLFKFGIDKLVTYEKLNKDFFHLDRQKIVRGKLHHVELGRRVFPEFPSFKIQLNRSVNPEKCDINYAKDLIGQEIFVDWPYLSIGLVESFRTNDGSRFSVEGKTIIESSMTEEERYQYTKDCNSIDSRYLNSHKRTLIGPIKIILDVKRLISNLDNGSAKKQWDAKTVPCALQTTNAKTEFYEFSNFYVESCPTNIVYGTPLEVTSSTACSIVANEQSNTFTHTIATHSHTQLTNQEACSVVAEQPNEQSRDVRQKGTGGHVTIRKTQGTKIHTGLKSDHDGKREYDEIFTKASSSVGVEKLNWRQLQNIIPKLPNDLKSRAEKLLPPFSAWTDIWYLEKYFSGIRKVYDLEKFTKYNFDDKPVSFEDLKKLNEQLQSWLKILKTSLTDVVTFEVIEASCYNEASTRFLLNEIIKAVLGDDDNYHIMVEEPVGHYIDKIGYIGGNLDYSFYQKSENGKKFLGLLEAKRGDGSFLEGGQYQATIEIITKAKGEQNLEDEKYFAIVSTGYMFRFMLLTNAVHTYPQNYTIHLSKIYYISDDLCDIISVFKHLLEVTSK